METSPDLPPFVDKSCLLPICGYQLLTCSPGTGPVSSRKHRATQWLYSSNNTSRPLLSCGGENLKKYLKEILQFTRKRGKQGKQVLNILLNNNVYYSCCQLPAGLSWYSFHPPAPITDRQHAAGGQVGVTAQMDQHNNLSIQTFLISFIMFLIVNFVSKIYVSGERMLNCIVYSYTRCYSIFLQGQCNFLA